MPALADQLNRQDLTPAQLTALEVLRRIVKVTGPARKTDWFKALPLKTVSERRFYDVVDALLEARLVVQEGEGIKRF
ncbi:MAG TPA: hypothetical protein VFP91_19750, partial [Vicinamibacterales bacterium]|nr:hypothetical protein [Vicinamibacterales bacterium]